MQNENARKTKEPATATTIQGKTLGAALTRALSLFENCEYSIVELYVCVGRKQLTLLLCALAAPLFALLLLLLSALVVAAAAGCWLLLLLVAASVGHWLSTHFSFRCGKE